MRSCSCSPSVIDRSSSTPAARSHQSSFSSAAKTICVGPIFAPAASVIALGARVDSIDSCISRLEDTIHLNFATILTRIDSLQSSHHPPSTPTSLAAVTSQPPLPVFPWVPQEVISQVANDTLKPEHLILLHNPKSRISKETPTQAGLVFADSQVRIAEESSEKHSLSFTKVIPNIQVLAQILIEIDQIYLWKGVTETPTAPSSSTPSSKPGAKSSRPGHTTANPPPVKICSSRPTPTPPRRVHNVTLLPASSSSGSGLADTLWPASSSLGSNLTGRVFPVASLGSGLVDWKLSATLPSTPRAPSASRAMLVSSLDFFAPQGIADMLSDSALTLLVSLLTGPVPPACPNTTCKLPIFDRSNTPATIGSLKLKHWAPFLDLYSDQDFANQLRGALLHGALLGYSGPLRDNTRLEGSNLPMDLDDELHLCWEIEVQVQEGHLQ
ncbi:uncharacterized protein UBRO2_02576 [Ustilago bromivora]|uniref:Uncharacterized protein n=1 Tax=Ustilago bromivora TaxID=307758 RepID=A0A8H8TSA6_9BASI|nr:uncharacterized protein UBRO2_02576 [Ustilago bromivora]